MVADILKENAGVLTSLAALLAGILGVFKYFQYRTRSDKMKLVREVFDSVVASLASDVEVERLGGAVLLRRFFDPKTELGIAKIPYWKEAVNVIAAILRSQATGNFQKLLADGLAFAPSLKRADLQRTNLQLAYLGSRKIGDKKDREVTVDLSFADFYRADLSRASLKKAKAHDAVFYQARMHGTVFTGADLRGANFFEADLQGAKFDGARLYGAKFKSARNIPPAIASRLDEKGVYKDEEPYKSPAHSSETTQIKVFISKPGCLDHQQEQLVASLQAKLQAQDMSLEMLERPDYPSFGAIGEVQRLMGDCAGVVIFGFRQLQIRDGLWRPGTPEEKPVKDLFLPTPWNQIEAGMAVMLSLPVLVLCQRGVDGGIFETASSEDQVYRTSLDAGWNSTEFQKSFADWCADVRERSQLLHPA